MTTPLIPKRLSLAEEIKETLLQRLTSGALKPGDRLVELQIAREMQTSQAPVREALRELEALGLIEMRRNRGAVVRGIDRDDLRNIYAVRAALEGLAIESAASDPIDLAADLGPLCDAMATAVAAGDLMAFADLNTAFHLCIVKASGNPVLVETWQRLEVRVRTAANLMRPDLQLDRALADHLQITALLARGAIEEASAALKAHIKGVASDGPTHGRPAP